MTPERLRELADHFRSECSAEGACAVCDEIHAYLIGTVKESLTDGKAPSEARGPFPDGDWLWGKLMDWCREHGAHPANYNDLFAIVDEARKARAANEPLTVYGADPASEQRGEVVAAEAPNAAAAKAVQPDGPAIDVVSAIHRHAKELARLTETWPADSAPPPPDVQGWQPIETAPRDTPILLSIFASGDPERERLVVVGGSSDGVTWIDHYDYEIHPPTHWMPLPSPPQAKEGGL